MSVRTSYVVRLGDVTYGIFKSKKSAVKWAGVHGGEPVAIQKHDEYEVSADNAQGQKKGKTAHIPVTVGTQDEFDLSIRLGEHYFFDR